MVHIHIHTLYMLQCAGLAEMCTDVPLGDETVMTLQHANCAITIMSSS